LAAIIISSPAAGRRPFRALLRALDANGQLHRRPIRIFCAIAQLLQHHVLELVDHPLSLDANDHSAAVSDRARKLGLGQNHRNSLARTMPTNKRALTPARRTTLLSTPARSTAQVSPACVAGWERDASATGSGALGGALKGVR